MQFAATLVAEHRLEIAGLLLMACHVVMRYGRGFFKKVAPRTAGWLEYPRLWAVDLLGVAGILVGALGAYGKGSPVWIMMSVIAVGMAVTTAKIGRVFTRGVTDGSPTAGESGG